MAVANLNSLPDPADRFALGECLGSGIDGNVFAATDTASNDMRVAIKIQKLRPDNESFIAEEHKILKNTSGHENLPDFHGAYKKETGEEVEIWFVMEVSVLLAQSAAETLAKRPITITTRGLCANGKLFSLSKRYLKTNIAHRQKKRN